MSNILLPLVVLVYIKVTYGTHFYGGSINWSPINNTNTTNINDTVTINIDQEYAWSRNTSTTGCVASTILSYGLIGDAANNTLTCLSNLTTCSSTNFSSNISSFVPCTGYNNLLDMSFGQSQTSIDLNVLPDGLIIGYTSSTDGWIPLQLAGGNWTLVMYLNLQPRSDNGLLNHSPTSSMTLITYAPITDNTSISIDIPISDKDGDLVRCRFAKSNSSLGGMIVDECQGVCSTIALPVSAQLTSKTGTCTLYADLTSAGNYAVAIQLEDFLGNSSSMLSSIPLQFTLIVVNITGTANNCTSLPAIIDIQPASPSRGSTITVQTNTQYTFTVIAQIACLNETQISITNFITRNPQGMLKDDNLYSLNSTLYAVNHTWTPSSSQLHQTFTFCTVAVDKNFYSSNQYCFNFFVDDSTTTTTETTTTTDTTTTTETTTTTDTTTTTETTTTTDTTTTTETTTTTDTTTTTETTTTTDTTTTTETTTTTDTTTTTETTTTTDTTTTTETTTTTDTTTTTETTTTTDTTTTTRTTTSSATAVNTVTTTPKYIPLILGLGLDIGLPLLIVISVLIICCCFRYCFVPLWGILRVRFGNRIGEDYEGKNKVSNREETSKATNTAFEMSDQFQLQNINDASANSAHVLSMWEETPQPSSLDNSKFDNQDSTFDFGQITMTTTSFLSPSANSFGVEGTIERVALPLLPPVLTPPNTSVLIKAYSKQQQTDENE